MPRRAPGVGAVLEIEMDEKEVNKAIQALMWVVSGFGLKSFHESFSEHWFKERARMRFAGQGDDASGQWAPLKDSREEIRDHQGLDSGPANVATGELERYILSGGKVSYGEGWSEYTMPGGNGDDKMTQKLRRAQLGAPVGHSMPVGGGPNRGTKPSPSATLPRPVLALSAVDESHLLTALSLFITDRLGREMEGV